MQIGRSLEHCTAGLTLNLETTIQRILHVDLRLSRSEQGLNMADWQRGAESRLPLCTYRFRPTSHLKCMRCAGTGCTARCGGRGYLLTTRPSPGMTTKRTTAIYRTRFSRHTARPNWRAMPCDASRPPRRTSVRSCRRVPCVTATQ
jgi:hypothetical protein